MKLLISYIKLLNKLLPYALKSSTHTFNPFCTDILAGS